MGQHYQSILRLQVPHGHYTKEASLCPDLQFTPSADTARWLQRYRCLMRPLKAGFSILQIRQVTNPDRAPEEPLLSEPLVAWDEPVQLTFYATVTNARFYAATDLPAHDTRRQLFLHSTANTTTDGDGTALDREVVQARSMPFNYRFIATSESNLETLSAKVRLLDGEGTELWKEVWKASNKEERDDEGDTVYDFEFSGLVPNRDLLPGTYTLERTTLGNTETQDFFLDPNLPNPMPFAVVQFYHTPGGDELDTDSNPEFQIRFDPPEFAWTYKVSLPEGWDSNKHLDIIDKKVENPNPSSPYPTVKFATNPESPNWTAGEVIEFSSVNNGDQPLAIPLLDIPNADLTVWKVDPGQGNSPDTPEQELLRAPNPSLLKAERTMYLTLK